MGFSQCALITLYAFSLGINLYLHGKERTGKYNFWSTLLSFLIIMVLLFMGGFFG